MIFSFSAFAAFLLISYYATSTSTKEVASYRNSYLALHQDKGKVIDHKSANSKQFRFCKTPNQSLNTVLSDVNSSQSRSEIDSISNIIFKGIVSPAGGVNLTYVNYLVNQSQVEMETGVVKCE
jgi:hypothetical protein